MRKRASIGASFVWHSISGYSYGLRRMLTKDAFFLFAQSCGEDNWRKSWPEAGADNEIKARG